MRPTSVISAAESCMGEIIWAVAKKTVSVGARKGWTNPLLLLRCRRGGGAGGALLQG
jgi:hypothetical protein